MERKGLLTRSSEGVAHVWRPKVSRREATAPLIKNLVRNVFGGRVAPVLQQLLGNQPVSDEELAEIRQVLEAHAERRRDARRGNRKSTQPEK
nr:BlaI/MecI/CopY family transcriptional regulator [Verrucomicrobiota bacterium]